MSTLPIVCNFGGRRMSGFQVIESRNPKKASLNKAKTRFYILDIITKARMSFQITVNAE